MTVNLEQILTKDEQSSLANEIVTIAAAVVSNASAPDFAMRSLEQGVLANLSPEQREAAMAMQAYGAKCAGEMFTVALDPSATERANIFITALQKNCTDEALAILNAQPESAEPFKSRICFAIISKCAELAAADIDRQKNGKINIMNEQDQQVFERQHEERSRKQIQAVSAFLSSLPERYPSFGIKLFKGIRQGVLREMEEKYKRPDIHSRIHSLFTDALNAMPSDTRTNAE